MLGMSKSGGGGGTTPPPGPSAAIPEPTGFVVFAIGAGVVGLAISRRNRKA